MEKKTIEIFPGRDFGIVHNSDEKPNTLEFALHNHNDLYEIVLFLGGDCEFLVEGNSYKLHPSDIFFTRPFELHHIVCLSEKTYDRIILFVKRDYFKKRGLEKYLDIFENRAPGTHNLIVSDLSSDELNNCMKRMYKYVQQGEYDVAECVLTELLYLINLAKSNTDSFYTKNGRIRDIIMYINEHLSDELSLDFLAERFFVSKNYLCKIFKESTGYTVNKYITFKRIIFVRELRNKGVSLLRASMEAGFNSYANFYKAYIKQTGHKPSDDTAPI